MSPHPFLRSSGAELPSAEELRAILGKESPRMAVKFNFLESHKDLFAAYREVSHQASSNDSWIKEYKSLPLEELVAHINLNQTEIINYIAQGGASDEALARVYESLIPTQDTSKTDAIFVFGAATNARIERAVELYDAAVAPKIIISGLGPIYRENNESEAYRMAKFAIKKGVPEQNIIIEESSITIPDNVKRTLDMLEQMKWQPASLTIVATDFVLQRACMEWYKFTPWKITIKPAPARPQSVRFTKDGWHTDRESTALVLNEYAKLVLESKVDAMRKEGKW